MKVIKANHRLLQKPLSKKKYYSIEQYLLDIFLSKKGLIIQQNTNKLEKEVQTTKLKEYKKVIYKKIFFFQFLNIVLFLFFPNNLHLIEEKTLRILLKLL